MSEPKTHIAFLDEHGNIVTERDEIIDNKTLEFFLTDYDRLLQIEKQKAKEAPKGKLVLYSEEGKIIHNFAEAEYTVAQVYEKLKYQNPDRSYADQAIITLFKKLNEKGLFDSEQGLLVEPLIFRLLENFKSDFEKKKSLLFRINKKLEEQEKIAKEKRKIFWLKGIKGIAEWALKRFRK